jgi:hypothetical protein
VPARKRMTVSTNNVGPSDTLLSPDQVLALALPRWLKLLVQLPIPGDPTKEERGR